MGTWTKFNANSVEQNRYFHSYFISFGISIFNIVSIVISNLYFELKNFVGMVFPGICEA